MSVEQEKTDPHTHAAGHHHDEGCGIPSYHIRDLRVRKDILAKAHELADLITTSEEVQMYRAAEKRIQEHQEVQNLIKLIKKRQKEAVAFEQTFKNPAMVKKIEDEIESLQDQLDSFPIVGQFKQTQEDLNYLLQLVVGSIRDKVSEKISIESAQAEPFAGDCNG